MYIGIHWNAMFVVVYYLTRVLGRCASYQYVHWYTPVQTIDTPLISYCSGNLLITLMIHFLT